MKRGNLEMMEEIKLSNQKKSKCSEMRKITSNWDYWKQAMKKKVSRESKKTI